MSAHAPLLSQRRARLAAAFDMRRPDRPPILGGWLAAPSHARALTGCSEEEYWADPLRWACAAEQALGSDGMVALFAPVRKGGYRCVDEHVMEERSAYTMESVVAEIESQPGPDAVKADFDKEASYKELKAELAARQRMCGDVPWCPADWDMNPLALWYHRYGYENALMLPLLEYALEPLMAAGGRAVWHCDGDVRPILDDLLACGVSGLQGFQRECGMELEWIVKRRSRAGDPLIVFGPLSVTRTLPHGTPEEVRAEVRAAMEICRDDASLVFFTSNTITPDVPLENVKAFWDEVLKSRW